MSKTFAEILGEELISYRTGAQLSVQDLVRESGVPRQTIYDIQNGKNFSIDSVGIEIGLPGINTKVLPGLTVMDISAYFNITQPFSQNRGLWTTLGGNVDFLGAPFTMNVTPPGPSAVARGGSACADERQQQLSCACARSSASHTPCAT